MVDRNALVTGGASGIGAAVVRLLVAQGAKVLIADLNADAGEALASQLRREGGEAHFLATDVSDENQVEHMVVTARSHFGSLDCAVNSAGVPGQAATLDRLTMEQWQEVLAVDLTGVWLCMKHELPALKEHGGGSIVNIASGAGLVPAWGMAAYCAAKHGVLGLTKTAAAENRRTGIRINAVLPGSTLTPMIEGVMSSSDLARQMVQASLPDGRFGQPEEIAEAVVWLCSEQARFVNGESLVVDGGLLCR